VPLQAPKSNPVLDAVVRHAGKATGLVVVLALYAWLDPAVEDFRAGVRAEEAWYAAGAARQRTAAVRYVVASYAWDGSVLTISTPAWEQPEGWSVDAVWARGRTGDTFGKNKYASRTVDEQGVEHLVLDPASIPATATSGSTVEVKVTYRLAGPDGLAAHAVAVPYEDAVKP
jgi:hypothetical protein